MEQKRGSFVSNIGFLMAAIGSAVGLGNIWGFPYKMGANGGFAFLFVYLILAIFVGFIVMLGELALGRKSGKGCIGTYYDLSKKYKWLGWLGVLSAFLIMSFYSVLGAYCIKYMVLNVQELFGAAAVTGDEAFGALITNQPESILYTVIFMVITCVIVMGGISGGIEKFSKIAMPALAIMLVITIVRSVTLPGAVEGLKFMFNFNLEPLKEDFFGVLAVAGGQMFFSLSLGMAIMITYGSYVSKSENLEMNALIIVISDTLVALMAGVAVLPAAFALGGDGAAMAGPSLLYVTMQNVFHAMGKFGGLFGAIFYLLVIIAAVTSSISLVETVTTFFIDRAQKKGKKGNRKVITLIACLAIMAEALVVAMDGLGSNGLWTPGQAAFGIGGWNDCWLDFMDAWSEGLMMPIGAFFMCLFIFWEYGVNKLGEEITLEGNKFSSQGFFKFCCVSVCPVALLFILYGQVQGFFGNQTLSLAFVGVMAFIGIIFVICDICRKAKANKA